MACQVVRKYADINRKDYPTLQVQRFKENGKTERLYYSFSSYTNMEKWIKSKEYTSFFEVIPQGKQKFKLDLDCKEDITKEQWNSRVTIIIDTAKIMLESKSYIRFETIGNESKKFSEHVVFTDVCVLSSEAANLALNDLFVLLHQMGLRLCLDIVDTGVYNSLQHFRVEGATKLGENRFKYVKGKNKISDSILPGLIRYTKNCEVYIPRSKTVKYKDTFKKQWISS